MVGDLSKPAGAGCAGSQPGLRPSCIIVRGSATASKVRRAPLPQTEGPLARWGQHTMGMTQSKRGAARAAHVRAAVRQRECDPVSLEKQGAATGAAARLRPSSLWDEPRV